MVIWWSWRAGAQRLFSGGLASVPHEELCFPLVLLRAEQLDATAKRRSDCNCLTQSRQGFGGAAKLLQRRDAKL
jgi:hypothetical protein